MDDVVVVGAGISGVACARELAAAGLPVRVVDRGRRVGGRLGGRRLGARASGVSTDLGASYLTASDPDFTALVEGWHERGLARPWSDTFTVLEPGSPAESKTGPMRWGAATGLRSLVEDLAEGLPVEEGAVEVVDHTDGRLSVDGRPAGAVVLAMPDPQAMRLLGPGLREESASLDRVSEPVIALAAWWPERTWDAVSPDGTFHGAFVNGDPDLAWVADDGRRHGDDAPVLVAHSTAARAAAHLLDPASAERPVLSALRRLLDLPEPSGTHVHRWSLARPTGERSATHLLSERLLGVCGDGWGDKPRVETAWLSGRALGRALAERLG